MKLGFTSLHHMAILHALNSDVSGCRRAIGRGSQTDSRCTARPPSSPFSLAASPRYRSCQCQKSTALLPHPSRSTCCRSPGHCLLRFGCRLGPSLPNGATVPHSSCKCPSLEDPWCGSSCKWLGSEPQLTPVSGSIIQLQSVYPW